MIVVFTEEKQSGNSLPGQWELKARRKLRSGSSTPEKQISKSRGYSWIYLKQRKTNTYREES
ncbi:hypothetical protein WN51_00286 [Melipona quadrifasciata]|uniref:Uncharacterized protein n=1 Tax=Melipona quadrifasciata TaxID=166423 RepID=A0A0M9A238_9HYME|nr:hypothetical protein WN51_00286 [Melipona quadrifasciata]